MSNNSEKKHKTIYIIYFVICVLLLAFSFIPVVRIQAQLDNEVLDLSYNGFNIMFGTHINELSGYINVNGNLDVKIKLNIMTILVYFLPLIGYAVTRLLKKDFHVVCVAMIVTLLISTVLSFLIPIISHIQVNEYAGIGLLNTFSLSLKQVGFRSTLGSYLISLFLCGATIFTISVTTSKK